ncbi:Eukaryotic translation initiation factor 2C, partial [Podila epigama]
VSLNPDVVPRPNRAVQVFKVKLKKVATINLEELHRFLDGTAAMSNNCLTAIMSLDILIRHMPAMLYATVGRSFYTPTGSQPLPGPLEVWRGYYQSARPTPGKMMINVDVSANAFYQGIPLLEMVMKILNLRSQDDLRRSSPPLNWVKVERIIKQLRITTTHRGTTQRSFKIERLTKNSAKDETFTIQTEPPSGQGEVVEKETNIAAYFQETYNRTLSFPTLPCVKLGRTAIVPMEVCKVVAGQRYPKKLDEAQTAEMIKFTSQNPAARANTIKEGLKTLNYDENPRLKDFGMKVSSEMAVIKARVLPAPTVAYNRTSPREASFVPRGGAWNLKDKKFVQPAVLGAWGVVVFGSERECPVPMVQSFVREFTNCGTACGMNIVNKSPPITFANPHGDVEMALKNLWVQTGNSVKSKPQLLVCVLPNTGTPLYAEIKRVTDTVIGVASQCLQMKHVKAAKTQYCANVCLKVNVKLGGSNADLGPNMMPFITSRPTIVIGADVSHPAPMDTTRPSIAAVVGSTDSKATRYAATVRIQTARTETISDLSDMIIELLKAFYQT